MSAKSWLYKFLLVGQDRYVHVYKSREESRLLFQQCPEYFGYFRWVLRLDTKGHFVGWYFQNLSKTIYSIHKHFRSSFFPIRFVGVLGRIPVFFLILLERSEFHKVIKLLMVSILPLMSNSSNPLSNDLETVPSVSTRIGITVTRMFHTFLSFSKVQYLSSFHFLLFLPCTLSGTQNPIDDKFSIF